MHTAIEVRLLDEGIDLEVQIAAPRLAWSLEFGFREGGTLVGATPDTDGSWIFPTGVGSYRVGSASITVDVDGAAVSARPLRYQPGQDYTYLGGTDAADGVRVRVGGTAPTSFGVRIRAKATS
jgi:hypothetical protein